MVELMDVALYYPYVRVPQTPWFTQVLLYWDQAASIVPYSLRGPSGGLDPYMYELERAGLLEYVEPDSGDLSERSEAFEDGFLEVLDQLSPVPERERRFTGLHIDKLSWSLFKELRKRGLAQGGEEPSPQSWWQVEKTAAGAYMAYLACAISSARSGMLPVTDQEQAIGTLVMASGDLGHQLAQLRYSAITRVLPVPSKSVPVTELKAFKEKNADKLHRCRAFLDGKLADLAGVADPELRRVKGALIRQEIEDDIKSLQESMKKRKWPRVLLVGFGGVMGAALTTAAAVATGGTALVAGLAVGAGVFQIGTATPLAIELMKQPRYNSRAPLAYAALASKL
jgi:hypothetical protein